MKRWMIAGTAVIGLSLAACGKKTEPAKPTEAAKPTEPAKPTEEPTKAEADAAPSTPPPGDDAAAATTPPTNPPTDDAAVAATDDAAVAATDDAAAPATDDAAVAVTDDVAPAPVPDPNAKKLEGYATPESVLLVRGAEAKDDVWIVSNVNGMPLDKDDNGYLSKVGPDGTKIAEKWIDGSAGDIELSAPKGSATDGTSLWVADIDQVRKFDLATGKPLKSIALEGATFANDIVIDSTGRVLVTDTGMKADPASPTGFSPSGSAAIWMINAASDEAKVLIKDDTIGNPNGIAAGRDGTFVTNGFDMSKQLKLHGQDGKVTGTIDVGYGMLDGLACPLWNKAGDVVCLTSSWESGGVIEVTRIGGTTTATKLFEAVQGPADFAYDDKANAVVLPAMMSNALEVHPLMKPIGEAFKKDE